MNIVIKEKENVDIQPSQIDLSKEIKSIGTFKVVLNLHPEIQSEISVKVISEENK